MKQRIKSATVLLPALIGLTLLVALFSVRYGAVQLSLEEVFQSLRHAFAGTESTALNERIFMEIRLPRVLLCLLVGASLAVGGVLLQGLFRNPIVEPGLVGTSCGAAFGAALYYALGATFHFNTGPWTLPLAACVGAICATFLVFVLAQSKRSGKSTIVTLLLTGIAINALFLSGVGFLSYIARDPQARSIVFWNLGTLSGANWNSVVIVGISTIGCILIALRYAKHLNALMMGEQEAQFLGVNIRKLKWRILLVNVILVAVATAFVGVISFVGLIVPHLLRILKGSDHRFLIVNSAIMGGLLLTAADLLARMALRPAELPIGIVTSIVGVPIFIFLLRKKNYFF
ncbi:MAG TPA: iron ABC transporter permease [Flavobacteriaceae bacterium]|nr:iron ABC transporter permease [Flavobacteriaceae bacterium]MCB9213278.1 iron ABC transporter permease [Alteromonas sp.]HPF12368.1 iron ABC transporter permease [Flavobacteriaceae bacterium]HQU22592.1 iron ABC transporter permease [Flavobacteriaceae bacterium]HQU66256.1 iron ABC transporter permease [Flavobacteriaceae bacterium]